MTTSIWFWVAFHIGVFVAIGVDLLTFHRRGRELSMAAAGRRSLLWVAISLAFNAVVWRVKGPHHGLDFLTGYLIEYSLSMDNIFVFVLIFTHFRVPPRAQHRVLVWGIIGALIMRGTMILFGIAFLLSLAAITALAVGAAMGLATLIGPLAGGVVAFLLFVAVAGGLAWYGVARLRKDL